jgi:carboxypeptidase Q
MKKLSLVFCLLFFVTAAFSQQETTSSSDEDALFIRKIYDTALLEGKAYDWLNYLTNKIGGRLAGSPQAASAVEYTRQMMDTMGMNVTLQPCIVPHWVRGNKEQARVVNSKSMGTVELDVLALGNSVGTSDYGLTAPVIEVQTLQEVMDLGKEAVTGKIVFYNRPMDATQIKTMNAYGGAVDQRVHGAAVAANYGAVGAIVRSMTLRTDDIPHTGSTVYSQLNKGVEPIPVVAVSTMDADMLSSIIKNDKEVDLFFRTNCQMLKPEPSYNVIGEIKGSEFPDEIILIGGHLDSWDVGTGAHDDGAGCAHSMDVYQVLKRLNYKPKRTIRVVMFMNEENGLAGGKEYARVSKEKNEYHLTAIESDRGGFSPRGFTMQAKPDVFPIKSKKVIEWLPLLRPYGLELEKGGSGADISSLKSQGGLLFGLNPDSQRYFDYHHTPIDVWDAVNKRELQLGVAAIASLVYLIDKHGL